MLYLARVPAAVVRRRGPGGLDRARARRHRRAALVVARRPGPRRHRGVPGARWSASVRGLLPALGRRTRHLGLARESRSGRDRRSASPRPGRGAPGVQHVAQRADGGDQVGVRQVRARRRRGARCPGVAEVADDAACGQRLDDAVGVRGAGARPGSRVGASASGDANSASGSTAVIASRRNRVEASERPRGRRRSSTPSNACSAASSASRDSIGGVPMRARAIPAAPARSRRHRERLGVPVPAGDDVDERVLVAARDVAERRGARAAVEVLVAAADGQVDVVLVEPDRHGTAEWQRSQTHQRTGRVGGRRDAAAGRAGRPVR